jgi:putative transposase
MLQSLSLKLVTSKEDDDLLIGTMTEYNKACNWVADKIFGLRVSKFQLQKMLYYDVKSLFNLPSQSVIRLIAKVVEAYKRDIKIKPVFRELGAIQYDERNSSIGLDKISLTTFRDKKRLVLKTSVGDYQKERFGNISGQCDLIRKNGIYYLVVTSNKPDKPEYKPQGVLGIDLGVENIAVDSDKQIFDSKKIEHIRRKYSRLRADLQHVGTRSAKRKLKKLSGKERRFKKDVNHCTTNQIISKAKGTLRAIAIENLKGIRSRVTVRRENRDKLSKWTFGEMRTLLEYKTKRDGTPLILVKPRNTSRQCPKCGYNDKKNRRSRTFKCLKCGYTEMADYVAALNIAARASVNKPHSNVSFFDSYKSSGLIGGIRPPVLTGGS